MFSAAAGHGATAVAGPKNERSFNDRGIDDDAKGFVNQVLRNVVGNIHDFLNHNAAVFEAVPFFVVVSNQRRAVEGEDHEKKHNAFSLHATFLNYCFLSLLSGPSV